MIQQNVGRNGVSPDRVTANLFVFLDREALWCSRENYVSPKRCRGVPFSQSGEQTLLLQRPHQCRRYLSVTKGHYPKIRRQRVFQAFSVPGAEQTSDIAVRRALGLHVQHIYIYIYIHRIYIYIYIYMQVADDDARGGVLGGLASDDALLGAAPEKVSAVNIA